MSKLADTVDASNPHGAVSRTPSRLQTRDLLRQLRVVNLGELVGKTEEYTVTGSYTPTRDLDIATATLGDVVAVLATLILDLKDKGPLE